MPTLSITSSTRRAALGGGDVVVEQGELDILAHRQLVDQIEALEDEADILLADVGELRLGKPGHLDPVEDVGAARRAESSIPSTLSRVDLPQPDGPMIATNSPSAMSRSILSSAVVSTCRCGRPATIHACSA
jgi:hypothetical protein